MEKKCKAGRKMGHLIKIFLNYLSVKVEWNILINFVYKISKIKMRKVSICL